MKKYLIMASLSVIFASSQYSFAGADVNGEVSLDTANRVFTGALGSVRASADNTQFIGCSMFGTSVSCQVRTAAGVNASCSSTNAAHIDTVKSISDDSRIYVKYDAAGACTTINVYNFSYWKSR